VGLYTYRLSLSLSGVRTVKPGKCKLASLPGDGLWLVPRHSGKNVPANEKASCGFFLMWSGCGRGSFI
jgi:hypothetical protein